MRQVQHRMQDSLRCHAMLGLEARRPATYGGLGDGVDGEACQAALRMAATELEASLLRGLLAGALWMAGRVCGHNMQALSSCPELSSRIARRGSQPERSGVPGSRRRQSGCSWPPRRASQHACDVRACCQWHCPCGRTASGWTHSYQIVRDVPRGASTGGSPGPGPLPPPPPWKLALKYRTISAKGTLRQICLNH